MSETDGKFTEEPVIGHHVSVERYTPSSGLSQNVREAFDLSDPTDRVKITVGDVDWDETKTLSIDVETFEKIIEWYEEQ